MSKQASRFQPSRPRGIRNVLNARDAAAEVARYQRSGVAK